MKRSEDLSCSADGGKCFERGRMQQSEGATMVPIVSGGRCVGFLFRRGREGIEAFDRDELSLGLFACPIEAAHEVEKRVTPVSPVDGGAP